MTISRRNFTSIDILNDNFCYKLQLFSTKFEINALCVFQLATSIDAVRINYVTAAPTMLPNACNYELLVLQNFALTKSLLFELETW